MKLATIVLGIAAAAVAAPTEPVRQIERTLSPFESHTDRDQLSRLEKTTYSPARAA